MIIHGEKILNPFNDWRSEAKITWYGVCDDGTVLPIIVEILHRGMYYRLTSCGWDSCANGGFDTAEEACEALALASKPE